MLFDRFFEFQTIHNHIVPAGLAPQSDFRANAQQCKAIPAAGMFFSKHEGISRAQKRNARQTDRLPFRKTYDKIIIP